LAVNMAGTEDRGGAMAKGMDRTRPGSSTAEAEKEESPTTGGARTNEEIEAEIDDLLREIHHLLAHNAIEVWNSYRQVRFE
jgi:hypothetical protein